MVCNDRVGLLARLEELLRREHLSDRLPIFVHIQNGILNAVVGIVFLRVIVTDQRIGPDLHLLMETQLLFLLLIEGGAREADYDYNDAEMDNVSTVASGVSACKRHHRGQQILSGMPGDHASTAYEFGYDRCRHKCTQ